MGAAHSAREEHCRRRTSGSYSAGPPSHAHADIDRWSLPLNKAEAKTPTDEAEARHYHTMDGTTSVYSTLRIVNLLNCSFHLWDEGVSLHGLPLSCLV